MSESDLRRLSQALRPRPAASVGTVPAQQFCGDIDMRIARDGTWFYHGSPIGRKPIVKLFASVLKRDPAGDYWLETPFEKCRIAVDDAPFTAVEMIVDGEGEGRSIRFRTNIDEMVSVDADHPIRVDTDAQTGEPAPYVRVRDGLDALILRSVFYDLVELGEEADGPGGATIGVRSGGGFFVLGPAGEAGGTGPAGQG